MVKVSKKMKLKALQDLQKELADTFVVDIVDGLNEIDVWLQKNKEYGFIELEINDLGVTHDFYSLAFSWTSGESSEDYISHDVVCTFSLEDMSCVDGLNELTLSLYETFK